MEMADRHGRHLKEERVLIHEGSPSHSHRSEDDKGESRRLLERETGA